MLEHLNGVEPNVILFTKEDQGKYVLPLLDRKQKVIRKTKQVECVIHYKKTHTSIKERSSNSPYVKMDIIKGFADKAWALCDNEHLNEEELKNVEDVFVANGFKRKKVQEYMKEDKRERSESEDTLRPWLV